MSYSHHYFMSPLLHPRGGAHTAGKVAVSITHLHPTQAFQWAAQKGWPGHLGERTLREPRYRDLPQSCLLTGIHDKNHTAFWRKGLYESFHLFLYKGFYLGEKELDYFIIKMPFFFFFIKIVSKLFSTWQPGPGWPPFPSVSTGPEFHTHQGMFLLNFNPAIGEGGLGMCNHTKWLGKTVSFLYCSWSMINRLCYKLLDRSVIKANL